MRYHEAADFLFGLRRFSVSPGTESVEALLDHLGNPERDVAFVQVAGSNGKGSTARMVESALRETGHRVGLYVSPHLEDLSERVRVDGQPMADDAIAAFVEEVKPWLLDRAAAGEPLTFFEVVTAMGIWQFARRDVDVAVLEVGLGGEYDATSAVDPVAAAVTNVSLEHTAVLGDTVEEIARTKARLARDGVPVVTACEGAALEVIREVVGDVRTVAGADRAAGADAPPTDADLEATYRGRVSRTDAEVSVAGDGRTVDLRIPLVGEHQATNAGVAVGLARLTAERLGLDLTDDHLRRGLARARWPGRFEVVGTDPLVVLDGAHNPAACETLAGTLGTYDYDDLHLVFGAMHDKDHAGMVEALPEPDTVVTCAPDLDRAEDPEVLARAFENAGVDAVADGPVAAAFERAREEAAPGDAVLLAGSLFAVAEARSSVLRQVVPRSVDSAADAADLLADSHVDDDGVAAARDETVHRVVTLRLQRRDADALRAAALAADVTPAVSAVETGEHVDVVLAGTRAAFEELVADLAAGDDALAGVAADLRERLRDPDGDRPDADREYPWSDGTAVMGVLNVTPDSFHDGGRHEALSDAVAGARRMVAAGVDVLDVGGESTRPGAEPVPVDEEIDRVVPVVEAVAEVPAVADGDVLVSIDTRKPAVAEAAIDAGADVINDVTGLEDPRMREVVAERDVPVVVMHSLDAPVVPDRDPEYDDVVTDVLRDLGERVLMAETAGIPRENVIVDPGIGFGKSPAENFELLDRVDEFAALGCPVLVGHSHKSMFGLIGREDGEREHATVAATALAAERGADIVRVHDVEENRAAVDVVAALRDAGGE